MGIAETFLNAENMRTLLLLIAMFSGFIWVKYSLHTEMEQKFSERDKLIDKKFKENDESMERKLDKFYQMIKANDFAHLNKTIVALTYTLQKNGFLKREDKEYIDGTLES
jgi:hypothetical protein